MERPEWQTVLVKARAKMLEDDLLLNEEKELHHICAYTIEMALYGLLDSALELERVT